MKQYNYLVLYLDENSLLEFIKYKIGSESGALKSEYNLKDKTLTVQYPKDYLDNRGVYQDSYYFINPELCDLPITICGSEFFGVQFLEGKYHSDDIMYALCRMRNGIVEVEGL